MEVLKRKKCAYRRLFTNAYNKLDALLNDAIVSVEDFEICFYLFKQKCDSLELIHKKYLDSVSDTDFENEYDSIEEYREKALILQLKAQRLLDDFKKKSNDTEKGNSVNNHVFDGNKVENTLCQRLPEVELFEFGGNLKDWLSFWNQFKNIHENKNLSNADKFHYLIQSTKIKSEAREIVESFPITDDNYLLAIDSLKERYARPDLLIDFYMRELLKLVLNNATKHKIDSLSSLYNELSTQLRTLSSLGVTTEMCGIMLYPLIESSLPVNILSSFERQMKGLEVNQKLSSLDAILLFLKNEVQSEEKIKLSRTDICHFIPERKNLAACQSTKDSYASAAELISHDSKHNFCLFCSRDHETRFCEKALVHIPLNEKERNFLRFLWYDDKDAIKIFRHARCVFGVTSSPLLLMAIIHPHWSTESLKVQYSEQLLEKLRDSFYVDNCVTSVHNIFELDDFVKSTTVIMKEGKFDLRGWESTVFSENTLQNFKTIVLGLIWDKNSDTLEIDSELLKFDKEDKLAKRKILSLISRIFDPTGYIAPTLIEHKILLQTLWKTKEHWYAELMEATIGARLFESVKDALKIENIESYFWTDSSTVLSWIKRKEQWSVFVNNRITEIRKLTTPENWFHISSELNPADLSSRGCGAKQLLKSQWWLGPDWLKNSREQWPKSIVYINEEEIAQEKRRTIVSADNIEFDSVISLLAKRISKFSEIVKILAWIQRFQPKAKDFRKCTNITHKEIRWKFNPPSAPWWGGFWERLIGILKDLLRKNLGCASLTQEELHTLVCECESIMNNRPLTYISEEQDLSVLTPSSFLREIPTNDVPDLDQIEKTNVVKRFRYIQRVRECLKQRFRKEYLGFLRSSIPKKHNRIQVGDIVLIGSEDKKRLFWPLAKVIELFPSKDEVIRLVKLRTSKGILLRPVQRLYPLEITQGLEQPKEKFPTKVEQKEDLPTKTRFGRVVRPVKQLSVQF